MLKRVPEAAANHPEVTEIKRKRDLESLSPLKEVNEPKFTQAVFLDNLGTDIHKMTFRQLHCWIRNGYPLSRLANHCNRNDGYIRNTFNKNLTKEYPKLTDVKDLALMSESEVIEIVGKEKYDLPVFPKIEAQLSKEDLLKDMGTDIHLVTVRQLHIWLLNGFTSKELENHCNTYVGTIKDKWARKFAKQYKMPSVLDLKDMTEADIRKKRINYDAPAFPRARNSKKPPVEAQSKESTKEQSSESNPEAIPVPAAAQVALEDALQVNQDEIFPDVASSSAPVCESVHPPILDCNFEEMPLQEMEFTQFSDITFFSTPKHETTQTETTLFDAIDVDATTFIPHSQ